MESAGNYCQIVRNYLVYAKTDHDVNGISWHTADSLSLSSAHRPDMTEILLKRA